MTTGGAAAGATWVPGAAGSGYDVDHLPFGVFRTAGGPARVGVRIGEYVLDAAAAAERTGMESGHSWAAGSLAPFLANGPRAWSAARDWLTLVFTETEYRDAVVQHLVPLADAVPQMPFDIGDFVDFYASEHHATALGRLFRPDAEPLLPNWMHLPVGYHGRSGTILVSGTDVDPAMRSAQAARCRCADVRTHRPVGHRGGGRVRRRRFVRPSGTRCPPATLPTSSSG